eukprot:scaffold91192_cov54-Phaeocystis_antarctica.AAC.2
MAINMVYRDGALASSRTGRLLVLLALPCVSHASQLPPAVENAVDFCISSRWGFSCFDASTTSRGVMARAGMAGMGRMVGRGALATMGAVVARETWVTMKELQQNKAGMAHQSLRQWLTNGPLPERQGPTAPAPAPAGITTGPILVADAVADAVAAEPMLAADAVAVEPSGLEEAGLGANADAWLAAEDTPAAPAPATPAPTSSMPAAAASTMKADISASLDAAPAARVGAALGPRAVASLPRSFPSRSRVRR